MIGSQKATKKFTKDVLLDLANWLDQEADGEEQRAARRPNGWEAIAREDAGAAGAFRYAAREARFRAEDFE